MLRHLLTVALFLATTAAARAADLKIYFTSDATTFETGELGTVAVDTDASLIRWDLTAAPPAVEILDDGRRIIFPTKTPGTFTLFVAASKLIPATDADQPPTIQLATAFRRITITRPGPTPAPGPTPNPEPAPPDPFPDRLRDALTGPDARTDAAKLADLAAAVADQIRADPATPRTYAQFDAAWKAARDAVAWPANRYPKLPALLREALPLKNADDAIAPAELQTLLKALDAIASAAEAIATP